MFSRLKEFLLGTAGLEVNKDGEPTDKDLQIATAVLLLHMAGSDEDYAPEEVKACFSVLERSFNIRDAETLEIFEEADQLRKSTDKIQQFIEKVNQNFTTKQKQRVLAMVWKVVLADEIIENYEQRFASELRQGLGLSREEAEEAKDLAESGKI